MNDVPAPAAPPAPDPAAVPPKSPRRRRWMKVFLVFNLLMLLLTIAAPWILTAFAPALLDRAEGRFVATDLRAEQIKVGWLSGATVRGFAIAEPEGFPPGDALSVANTRASLRLGPLLRGQMDTTIRIDAPVVRVRAKDGKANWTDIILRSGEKDAPAPDRPRERPELDNLHVDFELRDGVIEVYQDDKLVERLRDLRVTLRNEGFSPPFQVTAHGVLERGAERGGAGTLDLTAVVDPRDVVPARDLQLQVNAFDLGHYAPLLTAFGGPLAHMEGVLNGRVTITSAGGSSLRAGGEMRLDRPRFAGRAPGSFEVKGEAFTLRPSLVVDLAAGTLDTSGFLVDLEFLQIIGLDPGRAAALAGPAAQRARAGFSLLLDLDRLARLPGMKLGGLERVGGRAALEVAGGLGATDLIAFAAAGRVEGLVLSGGWFPKRGRIPELISLTAAGSFDRGTRDLAIPTARLEAAGASAEVKASAPALASAHAEVIAAATGPEGEALIRSYLPEDARVQMPVELRLKLDSPLGSVGVAAGESIVARVVASGTATAPEVAWLENRLQPVRAELDVRDGKAVLVVPETTLLNGGPMQVRGTWEAPAGDAPAPVAVALAWKGGTAGASLTPLLRYALPFLAGLDAGTLQNYSGIDFSAKADLVLDLAGTAKRVGEAWPDALARWSGTGNVELRDGSFTGAPGLADVLRFLGEQGRHRFDLVKTGFRLEGGQLVVDRQQIALGNTRIAISGKTSLTGALDHSVDLAGALEAHQDGKRILAALGGKLTASLRGTVFAPRIDMEDLAKQAISGFTENLLEQVKRDPAKAVEDVLDLLKKRKK